MSEEFVSEPIEPEAGTFSPELMASGLAGLPGAFTWRGRRYEIVECLEHRKISAAEGHKVGGERYLRRQQFLVRLDSGQTATIYVTRQAAAGTGRGGRGAAARRRWFLYTISDAEPGGTGEGPATEV